MASNGALNYIPNRSLTHIMYQSEDGDDVTVEDIKLDPAFPDLHLPPNSTVCSSSRGLLLIYDRSTHNYCLFNPTIQEGSVEPLPLPQRQHHPGSCIAILATTPSSFYVVFLMGPYEKSKNGHAPEDIKYHIDVFSSHNDGWYEWETQMSRTNLIQKNGFASCNRKVFLLVYTNTMPERANFVISLDTETGALHEIDMPYYHVIIDPRTVQLGRIGEALGFVIVDSTTKMVKIYTLNHPSDGEHSWTLLCLVKVELENECNTEFYDLDGLRCRIKCSEMPRATVKFESFELQLPLMVAGNLVVLESSTDYSLLPPSNFRLLIVDNSRGILQGRSHGLAHVASNTTLRYQILNYH